MLYCKYCYEEFNTATDLKAHENEFHQVPPQEKTTLEETERYVTISSKRINKKYYQAKYMMFPIILLQIY